MLEDFKAVAAVAGLKRGRDRKMLDEVVAAVQDWATFASQAGVDTQQAAQIGSVHRLRF